MRLLKTALFSVFILTASLCSGFETGYASWYGGKFNGRQTANGEIFDTTKFTAAHKTLPFGTMVKVTNIKNTESVNVRINDRGPFIEGRIIDLSKAAAETIKMTGAGVALVTIEIISNITPPSDLSRNSSFKIQVGAYSSETNAQKVKALLTYSGFTVEFEKSCNGIIRVVIPDIPGNRIESEKNKLKAIGFPKVLVRQE